MKYKEIQKILRALANPADAEKALYYFKTGKGDYAEADRFLGIRMPVLREQVKKHKATPITEITKLLKSEYHEERTFALLLLVQTFSSGDDKTRSLVYQEYLKHTKYINNWDLVDCSAHLISGAYLDDKDRALLYKLAKSKSLWERRIAIIATLYFIRKQDFNDTLKVSEQLLGDEEDLIHKATGWMLREVGNRDKAREVEFWKKHYKKMPRTMLRYAIEKFPKEERQDYMKGVI